MAASIWAMKLNDTLAAWFAGDAAGLTAAVSYVGSNGHISMYPGTEGLTIPALAAGVSLTRVGTGMEERHGITAFKGRPWHDVRAYGAKGDGTTNDTTAVQAAITAAETALSYIVVFPAGTYKINDGGLVCKRETWLVGLGEVSITMTSTTATLVKWATSVVGTGMGGGAQGIKFTGAGGSSTSTGISFGDPSNLTYYANRLSLIDCDVSLFGHGIVLDGPGSNWAGTGHNSATDGFLIQRCNVFSNVYNGLYVKCTFPIEISAIEKTHFHNNGQAQATGAAIQLSASGGGGGTEATGALRVVMTACTINVCSDGTLGMIHCPSTGYMDLHMIGCTFEAQTAAQLFIVALSDGITSTYNYPRSRIALTNCWLAQFAGTPYKELVILAAGDFQATDTKFDHRMGADFTVLACSNTSGQPTFTTTNNFITAGVRPGMPVTGTGVPASSFVKSVDSATQITINVNGTGAASVTLSFDALLAAIRVGTPSAFATATIFSCHFKANGTLANARVLNVALGSLTSFSSLGNVYQAFATAAALLINPLGCGGDGDLWTPTVLDYATGIGLTSRKLQVQSTTDPALVVKFDVSKVTNYGLIAYLHSMDSQIGFMVPVVATANLGAAGVAASDGKLVIENAGAGVYNFVFYANSLRFRVAGGVGF